jgi:phosphoribosylformylglycinamidine (FGAM) synthase-like enzyme
MSASTQPATLEQALEMGLRNDEFDKITEILGRTPTSLKCASTL